MYVAEKSRDNTYVKQPRSDATGTSLFERWCDSA